MKKHRHPDREAIYNGVEVDSYHVLSFSDYFLKDRICAIAKRQVLYS